MADTQETIADIAAEKRRMAEHIRENLSTVPVRRMDQEAEIKSLEDEADRLEAAHKRERESADAKIADLQSRVKLWTDRSAELVKKCDELYANARRRELPKNTSKNGADFGQLGDAAKLREALTKVKEWMEHRIATRGFEASATIPTMLEDVVLPALAAPPRNCDKYATADEALKAQEQMFNDSNFANGECKLGCPECDNPRVGCKIAWLFAPATEKEGENNGNE